MKKHTLIFAKENKDTFEAIRDNLKKIETRAGTVKHGNIKAGDTLVFSCEGEHFEKKVKKVSHFDNIPKLLDVFTPNQINPKIHTEEELTAKYYTFPNYREKIKEFGLLAFELE